MAKRNKLKNVQINEQELTPTVIGYLNDKGASPLFLIVIFGILFAFLYFLPEVNVYIEQKRGNDYSSNVPGVVDNNENEFSRDDAGKEFDLKKDTEIVIKEITLSNFVIDQDKITFVVKNNSDKIVDFTQQEYYLYLKDSDGLVNEALLLKDLVILENKEQEISLSVDDNEYSKIFIDKFKEEYISDITLVDNKLTCILEGDKYIYEFEDDVMMYESYVYESDESSESLLTKYQNEQEELSKLDGVDVTLSFIEGIYYKVQVDLAKADVKKLNDLNFFLKEAKAKIVKVKMENNGYYCS